MISPYSHGTSSRHHTVTVPRSGCRDADTGGGGKGVSGETGAAAYRTLVTVTSPLVLQLGHILAGVGINTMFVRCIL